MILEEKNKIQNTNIDNFNSFKVNISSVAIKAMIDMYIDKELAVVRELLTNAWDSHIIAKNTNTPIDIDLFATESNVLRIRDYGTGISEEDMQDYCTIYHSSKRNSNEQTGCWGIGSKVPFAIVDNYLVTTYYNGIKLTYLMSISDSIPKFSLLVKEKTTEPNGLEIQITTDKKEYLIQALRKFYNYIDIKLNIKLPEFITSIDKANIIYQTDTFKLAPSSNSDIRLLIDYGNNIYTIPNTYRHLILQNKLIDDKIKDQYLKTQFINFVDTIITSLNTVELALIIKVPLSAGLTITPSREHLENTEENKNKIINIFTNEFLNYFYNSNYHHTDKLIFKNDYYKLYYTHIELVEKIIEYIDKSYNINSSKLDTKRNLFKLLYHNHINSDKFQNKYNNILIINPTEVFTTYNKTDIYEVIYYPNENFLDLLYKAKSWANYKVNLINKSIKKVLILNSNIQNKYNLIPTDFIRKIKQYFGHKRDIINNKLQEYDLVILVDNPQEYELIKPILQFIKHHYGLDLHYSKLNCFLNQFRKNKRAKLTEDKNTFTNIDSINKYTLNSSYYIPCDDIYTYNEVSYTVKHILTTYNQQENTVKYCLLNSSNSLYINKRYANSIIQIIEKLDKLPIGFQNKLNRISNKYINTDLSNFKNFNIHFIQSPKANKDFIIKELKTKIDNIDIRQFYQELLKAISKLDIYKYDTFSIFTKNNADEFSYGLCSKLLYNCNNVIVPNKLINSLLIKYKRHKPTTEFGKNLYKKLKRIETKVYYSQLFNNMYTNGINSKDYTVYVLQTEKTVNRLKNIITIFQKIKKVYNYKETIKEIIKYSYRR